MTSYPCAEEETPRRGLDIQVKGEFVATKFLGPWDLRFRPCVTHKICNKTTVLYLQSVDEPEIKSGKRHCLSVVGDIVFDAWFKSSVPPTIDFGFYFAKPIHIKTSADSPMNVQELIDVHREICETVAEKMYNKAQIDTRNDIGRWPRFPCKHGQNYTVLPLCCAVMAVFDQPHTAQENGTLPKPNVLLVRTGDEERLSKPINFAPLVHDALPPGRSDLPLSASVQDMKSEDIRALRVTLDIGVKFLYDLQKQEEVAYPDLYAYLASGGDIWKNPRLTDFGCGTSIHFDDEEDFLREVYRDDMYSDAGENGEWIQRARKQLRRN